MPSADIISIRTGYQIVKPKTVQIEISGSSEEMHRSKANWCFIDHIREAAKKVIFLVARTIRPYHELSGHIFVCDFFRASKKVIFS